MDGGVALTAQDIARELMVDARRVRVEESLNGDHIGIVISRDSDQRWKAWREPAGSAVISPSVLELMHEWISS